jgi:phosphoenolpyruvate-protein phosphotransferase (PTS system enzyme I)
VKRPLSLSGIAVSPGVAMGRAVLWLSRDDTSPRRALESADVAGELERFRRAASTAVEEIERTAEEVGHRLGPEYAAIFHAHALFLKDRTFLGPIERKIEGESVNAEWAVSSVTESLAARFRDLPDENLVHRGSDLEDVSRTLRRHLSDGGVAPVSIETIEGEGIVLVADELTPSDAVRIPREKIVGFVTERGGRTSHVAILARSFGLPAVVAVPRLLASIGEGDRVIVDGLEGVVWREPTDDLVALFEDRRSREADRQRSLRERSLSGAVRTLDGMEISIRANIELASEIPDVVEYGADGVGLFRSEFLYLSGSESEFPDERTQAAIYRDALARLAPRPVVIRTWDLGGKKGFRQVSGFEESNPVLGLRGIRLCFKRPSMFRTQIRALLRAASAGDLRILVPMISGIEEMRRVQALIDECREELRQEGVEVPERIPLGTMIEVPAAAIMADLLAAEVDFLSLGTNDLIQYTLAVDRANETVSELFRPHHPAVLRLIHRVAEAAREAGKPVAVCGEMAGDPIFFMLLLGLGIREFSMGARAIPALKEVARTVSTADAQRVARAALTLATADEVGALLSREGHSLLSGELTVRPREVTS